MLGNVNRATWSSAVEATPELFTVQVPEATAHGDNVCNNVATPLSAQVMRVLPQLESVVVIEPVVSTMMAMLLSIARGPAMAPVDKVEMVSELTPKTLEKKVGMTACSSTRMALA
jgi:hypothetical protein